MTGDIVQIFACLQSQLGLKQTVCFRMPSLKVHLKGISTPFGEDLSSDAWISILSAAENIRKISVPEINLSFDGTGKSELVFDIEIDENLMPPKIGNKGVEIRIEKIILKNKKSVNWASGSELRREHLININDVHERVNLFYNHRRELSNIKAQFKNIYVVKRSGKQEQFNVDKLVQRIDNLCFGLDSHAMKPFKVLEKLLLNLDLEISTTDLDTLLMDAASSFIEFHQDYATLVDRYVHS